MKRIKNQINKLKKIICTRVFVLDSLFLVGIITFLSTNFIVNTVFGLYSIAIFLVALSIYLSNTKQK